MNYFDINKIAVESQFSGVIQVSSNSITTLHKNYGYSHLNEKIKNSNITKFSIASATKFITAIAIMQLIEKGSLQISSNISSILDIKFPYFSKDINIYHLLTHTSGIVDYIEENTIKSMDQYEEVINTYPIYRIYSLKDYLPLFQNNKMKSNPGEKHSYNNAGYIILGLVIEKISGLTYYDYIAKHIFNQAGMSYSGFYRNDMLPSHTAYGYRIDKKTEKYKTHVYSTPNLGGSDSGLFTTTDDIRKLWISLFDYKLISKEAVQFMIKHHVKINKTYYYGIGLYIRKGKQDNNIYEIVGQQPGYSFFSVYAPNGINTSLVTVCSNREDGVWPFYDFLIDNL